MDGKNGASFFAPRAAKARVAAGAELIRWAIIMLLTHIFITTIQCLETIHPTPITNANGTDDDDDRVEFEVD